MAAAPYRCTVTVDGTKFNAVSTSTRFSTAKDHSGSPQMGSLSTDIRVWVDFHDDTNLPFANLKKLFDLANVVTRGNIKDVKIEFWKDDSHQDALCSYSFKGWISRFETTNPHPFVNDGVDPKQPGGVAPQLNHMLVLDIEPALNQDNFSEIKLSN
ncbi:MAG: hypothetical protein M3Z85_07895 [Acidobacteriota bacterium]|nr:hypothetical protein [Acidobacteriota bacterium]